MSFKRLCVYGSLRKGDYNFDRFLNYFGKDFEYQETTEITGYKLYSLGAYPFVQKTDNEKNKLIVDIIKVSEECANNIDMMERGAGYNIDTININGEECTIYTMDREGDVLVESGDWIKFKKQNGSNQ